MQLVMLGGELGEKYGTEHKYYNLRSPAEAIKLLCVNYPALQKDLTEAHQNGVGYKVIQGGAAMGYDELHLPFGSRPLLVVPVISGAGSGGTSQILLGVGLVAASFLFPGAGLFGTLGLSGGILGGGAAIVGVSSSAVLTAAAIGTGVSALGASLILSGTANLISPQPEVPKLRNNRLDGGTNVRGTGPQGITRGASGEQSYAFTGPKNTVGTGATVPVIYGRVITGGHLLSLDIDVSNESDPLQTRLGAFSRKLVRINDEKISNSVESAGGLDTRRIDPDLNFVTSSLSGGKAKNRVKVAETIGPNINTLVKDNNDNQLFISNDTLKYRKNERFRTKVDVVFRVANSFFDFVGDATTTKIDGFISYVVTLKLGGGGLGNAAVANASATLQGKFQANARNPYTYGHRFEIPESSSARDVKIEVEVTDASVNDNVTFELVGYGYGLF